MNIEILLFDGVDELDVIGPFSALANAGIDVALVAETGARQVRTDHGTALSASRAAAPTPEVLIVPGGGWLDRADAGAWAEARRGVLPRLIADRAATGTVVAAVCTGAMLVAEAGLLIGRPAVTNHRALADLAAAGADVIADARVVDDGDVITSGGVTAGIDLGLWLLQRYLGPAAATKRRAELEYPGLGRVWCRARAALAPSPGKGPDAELELPKTALCSLADELAKTTEPEFLYNHSVRSYLFARVAAASSCLTAGQDYDDELLFLSCVLHDIGLVPAHDRGNRFEVDGADSAVELLRTNGLDEPGTDIVWQAIALHTSPGIAERRKAEVSLTRKGIAIDFGGNASLVDGEFADAVHGRYPRLDMARCLTEAIVGQALERPAKAPLYTLPAGLVRERAVQPHVTSIERLALNSRWGC
jgi:putative intracellular protease/amidase